MRLSRIGTWLELIKFRIVALSTLTGVAGYVLAAHRVDWRLLGVSAGLFLLAGASAAINHVQDRRYDVRMQRTRNRPLPSERMTVAGALRRAALFGGAGSALLYLTGGWLPLVLGLAAAGWYNGVYTPLKRLTAFACVPGAVIGAIPPAVGWTAAGGNLADPRLLAVSLFFFLWQVPHFWLLMLAREGDYAAAGLPTLGQVLGRQGAHRVVGAWMLASAAASPLLAAFGIGDSYWFLFALVASFVWMTSVALRFLFHPTMDARLRTAFGQINLYAVLVIVLVLAAGFSQVD